MKGRRKLTCMALMAVALPVCWYIQMLKAKPDILLANTDTIWPIQTNRKPAIPPGLRILIADDG